MNFNKCIRLNKDIDLMNFINNKMNDSQCFTIIKDMIINGVISEDIKNRINIIKSDNCLHFLEVSKEVKNNFIDLYLLSEGFFCIDRFIDGEETQCKVYLYPTDNSIKFIKDFINVRFKRTYVYNIEYLQNIEDKINIKTIINKGSYIYTKIYDNTDIITINTLFSDDKIKVERFFITSRI